MRDFFFYIALVHWLSTPKFILGVARACKTSWGARNTFQAKLISMDIFGVDRNYKQGTIFKTSQVEIKVRVFVSSQGSREIKFANICNINSVSTLCHALKSFPSHPPS